MLLCNDQLAIGYLFWKKEEDQRKGFNIACTQTLPNTSCISEQFRDIPEVILYVFNNKKWIDSTKSKKRKTICVVHKVNPMEDDDGTEDTPCDLTKPRIAPYRNTWTLSKYVHWCNVKLTQERGLQFDQTRSNAIVFHNTLPAVCIEKAVCMKTKEELYLKVRLTPRLPRVVLKPNSRSTRPTST